jgi:threonine dehydrogenase-like Zn-dependent dehydrogenase
VERPLPEPAAGEVRIRIEGSGVCASDLPLFEGRDWARYPQEPGRPGHEGWGVVDALGEGVTGLARGDRVATLSTHAYAEYDVCPAAECVRIPEALAGRPFPGEPIGCAVNVLERSGLRPGDRVALVGAGFLGLLFVQLAAAEGARVVVLSRRPTSLAAARRMGAAETIALDDQGSGKAAALRLTGGAGFDCVVEATGHARPLDVAARLVRVRGRLVVAGYHVDPRQVDMQSWNWRGIDVVNAHERAPERYVQGIRRGLGAVLEERLTPWPLFTHRFPLERVGDALRTTLERPEGFVKALVQPLGPPMVPR